MAKRNGGFVRKKVSAITLGERLQHIRSERRLTFSEISRNTGIPVKYLEALERGSYEHLPATVYVHGFLRSYAKFLGEKPDRFVADFERERGIAEHLAPEDDASRSRRLWAVPRSLAPHAITPQAVVSVGFVLLLVGVLWYVQSGLFSFVASPQLFITSPESGMETRELSVLVEGKTDSSATLFFNGENVLIDEEGSFSKRVEIGKGTNTLIIESVNTFGKKTQKTLTIIGL
jgi:cytoskeletal protein RodZ